MRERILPFAVYLVFLAVEEAFSAMTAWSPALARFEVELSLWLYPVKATIVLAVLVYFWPRYGELKQRPWSRPGDLGLSLLVGFLVYLAWVQMDWPWAVQGDLGGYNPFQAGNATGELLATARVAGAVLVVPVMEELFWRSFLIRYLISARFQSVQLGMFTPFSFLCTVVLFGLEHNLWLAGMMAGAVYTILLYRTGRLWSCILAHATTNLALAIHVLVTEEWWWW